MVNPLPSRLAVYKYGRVQMHPNYVVAMTRLVQVPYKFLNIIMKFTLEGWAYFAFLINNLNIVRLARCHSAQISQKKKSCQKNQYPNWMVIELNDFAIFTLNRKVPIGGLAYGIPLNE